MPNCFICVSAAVSDRTYCTTFGEMIDQESVTALDCLAYVEDLEAT